MIIAQEIKIGRTVLFQRRIKMKKLYGFMIYGYCVNCVKSKMLIFSNSFHIYCKRFHIYLKERGHLSSSLILLFCMSLRR